MAHFITGLQAQFTTKNLHKGLRCPSTHVCSSIVYRRNRVDKNKRIVPRQLESDPCSRPEAKFSKSLNNANRVQAYFRSSTYLKKVQPYLPFRKINLNSQRLDRKNLESIQVSDNVSSVQEIFESSLLHLQNKQRNDSLLNGHGINILRRITNSND